MTRTITELLHDITQLDYEVQFCSDFNGMIRVEYRKEWDKDYYHHEHRGFPGATMKHLEEQVYHSLINFLEDHNEELYNGV